MLNEDSFVLLYFSKIKNNEGEHNFESKIISESFLIVFPININNKII